MYKRILVMLVVFLGLMVGLPLVNAEGIKVDDFVGELKKSELVTDGVEISNRDDKIIISDNRGGDSYQTVLVLDDNCLIYEPEGEKEVIKNSTVWIDEVIRIVLDKFGYGADVLNNLDFDEYTFSINGIEATKNSYVENDERVYYYFYLKLSLDSVDLENRNDDGDEGVSSSVNEIKEETDNDSKDNNDDDDNKYRMSSGTVLYIEIFCFIIAIILLILNSATKKD